MAGRKKLEAGGHDPGFDLTPMIDVVFQLIIFFIVTMAFAESQVEARVTLPVADQAKPPESVDKDLFLFNIVNVNATSKTGQPMFSTPFIVDGRQVTDTELAAMLQKEAELSKAASPDGTVKRGVIIRGDKDAQWQYIMVGMGKCQAVGIQNVYLQVLEKSLENE